VGELLVIDDSTARELLAFLRERAPSSFPITIDKLASTRSRLALELCHDEAIAASLAADFSLVTPAVFHYTYLTAVERNRAASDAYREFGLSGELAAPLDKDFSLNPHPNDATMARFHTLNGSAFLEAIGRLPPNARPATLLERFNTAALHLAALLQCDAGLRVTKTLLIGMRALEIDDGWAVVTDKFSSNYWQRRVASIPDPCRPSYGSIAGDCQNWRTALS